MNCNEGGFKSYCYPEVNELSYCRWQLDLNDLKQKRIRLLGDCLVSSAFLSYVGAFSWEFRNDMVYKDWVEDLHKREVPLSEPFKLEELLTNEVEVSKYVYKSLQRNCENCNVYKK